MEQKKVNKIWKWIKISKKRFLVNLIIFILVFTLLIIADQVTKGIFFNKSLVNNQGQLINNSVIQPSFNWGWIKIYSLPNIGVTSGIKIDAHGLAGLGIFGVLVFLPIILLSKNNWFTFSLTILFTGIFGNTIDRLDTWNQGAYVKDIFHVVGFRGVFNLADLMAVFGAVSLVLELLLFEFVKPYFVEKRDKKLKTHIIK